MHEIVRREFATVRETAGLLNVGISHVYNLIARKELPAKKFGGAVRIAYDAIEAYVARSDAIPSIEVPSCKIVEADNGA